MLNLLFKEYLMQKRYFGNSVTSCLLLFFGSAFLSVRMGLKLSPVLLGTICFVNFMMNVSCSVDDKQNTDTFLVCLPIGRWEIVFGKFLWLLGLGGAAFACLSFLSATVAALRLNLGLSVPGPAEAFAVFSGICALATIYFPSYFRNGFSGSRFVSLMVFAGAIGVGSGVLAGLSESASVGRAGFAQAAALVLLATAAATAVGLGLASRFYAQREL